MSERSEFQTHGTVFAAPRRRGHWCLVMAAANGASPDWRVHP